MTLYEKAQTAISLLMLVAVVAMWLGSRQPVVVPKCDCKQCEVKK